MNREKIDLAELKKIQLALLTEMDMICAKEGYKYSLGGGSLLGAIRHKGYIPWDDDIDVMMPRPDYEKFLKYCKENKTKFALQCHDNDPEYVDLSAKIYDPKTTIEEKEIFEKEKKIGVSIDVFVIDGLGDTEASAIRAFRAKAVQRELIVASQWKNFFRSKTHAWYYEPIRLALFVASRFINKKSMFENLEKYYKKISFEQANFAGAVGGSYREKEILPKEVFTEYIDVKFENSSFKAIAAYDTYLSSIYGDYMQLPPKEKQVSHHLFNAYYR
jgi:lipopolysaccharide cholinephosphotransferase